LPLPQGPYRPFARAGPHRIAAGGAPRSGDASDSELARDGEAEGGGDQPAKKSYRQILTEEIREASKELYRPRGGLFLSAISAGLDVGFSMFAVAVALTLYRDRPEDIGGHLLIAAVYSLGYIFVVIGRSELFTEHTTLAVLPVLNRNASVRRLAEVWGIVYAGNLIGVTIFAFFAAFLGPALGIFGARELEHIATDLVDHDGWTIGASAVMAGWLMGLLSWLVTAARDTISQIAIVLLITGTIGLGHLHHCIVGACEVLAAVFAGTPVGAGDFGHFLLWSTLGNAVGGVLFVAIVKYAHASRPSHG
jgi:formate/nitrite transporter FocA (FNT family)